MKCKIIGTLGMALVLSACGGGGSSDDVAVSSKPKDKPAGTQKPTAEQTSWVSGLYDGSTYYNGGTFPKDESYYHIDESGVIHTYDYMNDGTDSSGNCYQPVPKGSAKVNGILEGLQLYWDADDHRFATKTRAGTLYIDISPSYKDITGFSLNGTSSNDSLVIAGNDYTLAVRAKKYDKKISLSEIQSMMCDS